MSGIIKIPVSITIIFIFVLSIFWGCVASKQPSVFEINPKIISQNYTPQQTDEVAQAFKNNPDTSQDFGNLILWQMHQKSPEFAMAMAELPDIVDGIDPKEAVAMVEIYHLLEPINIPVDLFKNSQVKPEGYQSLRIMWTGNRDTPTKIFGNFSRHSRHSRYGNIISFSEISFEKGDNVDLESFEASGVLTFNSTVDISDTDGIQVELTWNDNAYIRAIPLYLNKPIQLNPDDLNQEVLIFDQKDGIEGKITITGNPLEKSLNREQTNLRNLVLLGLGEQKYSAPLEALLWGFMDERFKENPLVKFNSMIAMTKVIWGNMDGEKWDNYGVVIKRVGSDPGLTHYYTSRKFSGYRGPINGSWENGYNTFLRKGGHCIAWARFGRDALLKNGYNARIRSINWPGDPCCSDHSVTVIDHNNGTYTLATDAVRSNVTTFNSLDALDKYIAGGRKITGKMWGHKRTAFWY